MDEGSVIVGARLKELMATLDVDDTFEMAPEVRALIEALPTQKGWVVYVHLKKEGVDRQRFLVPDEIPWLVWSPPTMPCVTIANGIDDDASIFVDFGQGCTSEIVTCMEYLKPFVRQRFDEPVGLEDETEFPEDEVQNTTV